MTEVNGEWLDINTGQTWEKTMRGWKRRDAKQEIPLPEEAKYSTMQGAGQSMFMC